GEISSSRRALLTFPHVWSHGPDPGMGVEKEEARTTSVEALTSGAMAPVWERVRRSIPPGTEIFDCHSHIGTDVDGHAMSTEGLIAQMRAAGVSRNIVFPLNDP